MNSVAGNVDRYLEAQVDEIEVLCSIYGDEWKIDDEGERSYSIEITGGDLSATLYITLPESYPFESPPLYTIFAPNLSKEHKNLLANKLNEVYLENIGQTVLYQWIEEIRECLTAIKLGKDNVKNEEQVLLENNEVCGYNVEEYEPIPVPQVQVPDIIHGEIITDRKSTFQGHVAAISNPSQVTSVLEKLKENKKIANATHNIYAYRILKPETSTVIQDCEDDGETQAGGRMLHLLQIVNVQNVLVVVSRWYGGIHLGSDRFRHINNAARQVLEQAGLIDSGKKKKM